jgi:hypothetical protein
MRPETTTNRPQEPARPVVTPPTQPKAGELSDRDLEQVAGGKSRGGRRF